MHVREWAITGVLGLGLVLAVLSGTPAFGFQVPGQAIIAAPYVLFAWVAALSDSLRGALILAGACLVLHVALFQGVAADALRGLDAGAAAMLFGLLGPGLLALLALGILSVRWLAWLTRPPGWRPPRDPPP